MQAPRQVQRGSGKGSEGSGEGSEGSGEGLGSFGAEPGHVQQGSGEGSGEGALVQSQVKFNGGKVWEKVPGRLGSGESSGEGRGGLGAEPRSKVGAKPGQVQQGSGQGSGRGLGGFGAKPGQVQQGSEEGSRGSGRLWCRATSGSTVPEKVPDKAWEALARARSNLTGFAACQFRDTKLRCNQRCVAARFRKI